MAGAQWPFCSVSGILHLPPDQSRVMVLPWWHGGDNWAHGDAEPDVGCLTLLMDTNLSCDIFILTNNPVNFVLIFPLFGWGNLRLIDIKWFVQGHTVSGRDKPVPRSPGFLFSYQPQQWPREGMVDTVVGQRRGIQVKICASGASQRARGCLLI